MKLLIYSFQLAPPAIPSPYLRNDENTNARCGRTQTDACMLLANEMIESLENAVLRRCMKL